MAILIDPPAWPAHGTLWSHLVSDTGYEELHAFAARLPVPRRGFDLDHYDVPAALHARAVALGALPVTGKELVLRLRGNGLRVRQIERETVTPLRRRQFLRAEWMRLGALVADVAAPVALGDWDASGERLLGRWNEPHRAYHDERHLEDVLLALDELAVRGERVAPATLLAAWFHDAVYTGRGADEHDSARLASEALAALGLDPRVVRLVADLIVGTEPGRTVLAPAPQLAQLLDADLAIFAARPHRYLQYTAGVRAEYAHVPEADFRAGRARILGAYLGRASIYRTDTARRLWERRARANLEFEIDELRLR